MIELSQNDFPLIEPFFKNKKQYVPALSVIHGNFPGRIFVNQLHEPSLAVVWATSRWMYLEGNTGSERDKELLVSFIKEVVITDCKLRNVRWFEIYTADADYWDGFFKENIKFLKADKHFESVYTLNLDKFNTANNTELSSFSDITVDFKEFEILPEEYHELPYVDQKFKAKTRLGIEIRKENDAITVCRNNGFEYMNEYFIDVDTFDEKQRNKGYATLAARKLIEHYLNNQMSPLWETTHQNTPSHKLALKLGFEVYDSYPVYACIISFN